MNLRNLRATATVLLMTTTAVAAAGCGGGGGSGDAAPAAGPAQRGGTLKLATAHDITSFNQLKMVDNESIRVISQITEGLYKTDAKGRLRPWLATADRASADGLTHTLALRPGVRFSSGAPLTAADVKFTLDHVRASEQWGFILANVRRIDARGDATVVLRLKQPIASLHANLALFVNGIVPKDFGGATEARFAQHPVGTGPFLLSRWDRGTRVVLARNDKYWQKGTPLLDTVELVGVPDDNSRITQLRGRQVDGADRPPWPQLDAIDRTSGLHVGTFALTQVDSLQLNTKKAPFQDRRVRRAVSLALDRDAMVKASLSGRGQPAGSFLAPSIPFHASAPAVPRQEAVDEAKRLVQEAGSPKETVEVMFFAGNAIASTLAQVLQQNLEDVGLDVKLLPLDQSAVLDRGGKGNYIAAISAISSDILDPSELAAFYVGTNGFSTFSNPPALAALADRAAREDDPAQRSRLYADLQRGVIDDYGFVPLQVEPQVWALSDRVRGFTINGTGIFDLATVGVA
jgi:peptide/nickel transport system substrate-binding protein